MSTPKKLSFMRICKSGDCLYLPVDEEGCTPFGFAMMAVKKGFAITRKGWNGKGMFVYLVPAGAYPAQTGVAKQHFGETLVPYRPYLALKTAQGDVATWAPSGSDALADDWVVLTEVPSAD